MEPIPTNTPAFTPEIHHPPSPAARARNTTSSGFPCAIIAAVEHAQPTQGEHDTTASSAAQVTFCVTRLSAPIAIGIRPRSSLMVIFQLFLAYDTATHSTRNTASRELGKPSTGAARRCIRTIWPWRCDTVRVPQGANAATVDP